MSDHSPIEVRQAALLAHGLSRGPGHDWSKVDPEVQETLFALRPELAPAPRDGLLEEALAEVMEGPLAEPPSAEELAEAAAFADALRSDRTDPSELSADLGAAVYGLSPGRAPAPDLSIDDILDSVSTGPFAPVIRITGEFPAVIAPPENLREAAAKRTEDLTEAAGEVVSLAAHRPAATDASPPTPARRPAWFLPAMGVLAAAAATLLFVVPSVSMYSEAPAPGDAAMAPAPREERARQAPEPAMAGAETMDRKDDAQPAAKKRKQAKPKTTSTAPMGAGSAGPPPAARPSPVPLEERSAYGGAPPPPPEASAPPAKRGDQSVESKREAAMPEPEPEPAEPTVTDSLEALGYLADDMRNTGVGGMSNSGDFDDEAFSEGDLAAADVAIQAALEDAGADGAEREDAYQLDAAYDEVAANTGVVTSGSTDASELAEAEEEQQPLGGEVRIASESRSRPRRSPGRSYRAGAPKAAEAVPAAPAADAPVDASRSVDDLGLIDRSLASRRPDLANIWAAAEDLRKGGNFVGAARTLWRLATGQADAEVVVDAAVRAGQMWLMVGDTDKAEQALQRARSMSIDSPALKAARSDLGRQIEQNKSRNTDRTAED